MFVLSFLITSLNSLQYFTVSSVYTDQLVPGKGALFQTFSTWHPNTFCPYCLILTQCHQVPTGTAFYWPSTIIYQPAPTYTVVAWGLQTSAQFTLGLFYVLCHHIFHIYVILKRTHGQWQWSPGCWKSRLGRLSRAQDDPGSLPCGTVEPPKRVNFRKRSERPLTPLPPPLIFGKSCCKFYAQKALLKGPLSGT